MALNLHRLVEVVPVHERFTVTVYAVMTEQVSVRESLFQTFRRAFFTKLGGRVPRRFGGLFPGRGGH